LLLAVAIAGAAPNLTGVFNAASWAYAGLPNGDIAQGSIFTVTGTGMGPATLVQAQSYPLPTSQGLSGTSVRVTVAGTAKDCIMIYTVATQVAAILPSSTPTGAGTLTVTYQGTSASTSIRVTAASVGIFAVNQQGNGPGVITDAGYSVKTLTGAAHPGDVLIIWATGLGPITSDETLPPTQVDLKTGVQVFVGGQSATVSYGGRGSSAGLDQINFTVPAASPTGCYVPVAVKTTNGVVGNFVSIPIASQGNVCSDPAGFLASDLAKLQTSGALKTGAILLDRAAVQVSVPVLGTLSINEDSGSASFAQYDSTKIGGSRGITGAPSIGTCSVFPFSGDQPSLQGDPVQPPGLDAGPQLNVTGANGTKALTLTSKGSYSATLGGGGSLLPGGQPDYLNPGTYTVDNGTGGADVGPFKATLTIPAPLTWTNQSSIANVPRSANLTVTWSGGEDLVTITGFSSLSSPQVGAVFICTAQASAGTFTIPSLVLSLLPPSTSTQGVPTGFLAVGGDTGVGTNRFTAYGLNVGYFYSVVLATQNVNYQ